MDIKNILRFLFPEYQIVESIRKYGFISNKKPSINSHDGYTSEIYKSSNPIYKENIQQVNRTVKKPSVNSEFDGYSSDFVKYSRNDIDSKFANIRQELPTMIVGQKYFLERLLLAFKRPYVAGYDGKRPRNTIFIIGEKSSGRHTSVEAVVELLNKNKVLNSDTISRVDLSIYPTISEESIFLSDLYKSLYLDSEVIVFDSFEKCNLSFIDIISKLVIDGKYRLNARYGVQNKNLVETTGVLMKDSISEISSNGKYFVFITEQNGNKIVDTFGSEFMSYIWDMLNIDKYSKKELVRIAEKFLRKLSSKCNNSLSLILKYDNDLAEHCAEKYSHSKGIGGIVKYIQEDIYKPLSEYKLKNKIPPFTTVELFISNDKIMANLNGNQLSEAVDLSKVLINKYISNVEEVKKELNSIIGLNKVKDYILSLENNLKVQKMREQAGFKTSSISMNMLFIGNPGTGKTTIARLVAKYLKAIGVLSNGQLKEVTRADLVGQYVGHTAKLTNQVIQSALGGVLFIDEAYSLCRDKNDIFGLEAIDALVKGIEDNRDNLVVILAGYKDEMEEFLKSNTGLKSRFPNIIEFEDYTPEEMYEIVEVTAKSKGYRISEDCRKPLLNLFERSQLNGKKDLGNGRLVRNIIESAILEQSKRILGEENPEMDLLTFEDFKFQKPNEFDLNKELDKIVGLTEVKTYIRSLYARLRLQNERKKLGLPVDDSLTLHMIFKGNPGTGKTTVARLVADVLYNIGVIKSNKLVETDRAGLVAGYVGQTAIKTTEKVMEAMNGVLFIDEAYSLSQGGNDFGKEAIDTLVKLMDDYRDRLVVILAGYSNDMNDFLKVNPGLKSRFPNIIEFHDYNLNELMIIAERFYESKGYILRDDAKEKIADILRDASREDAFGNGRYVRNLFERSINNQALRLSTDMDLTREELTIIEAVDIERV